MVRQVVDAVYQQGVFRPTRPQSLDIREGQRVRLAVDAPEPAPDEDIVDLLGRVYDGLSEQEADEVEKAILSRRFTCRKADA